MHKIIQLLSCQEIQCQLFPSVLWTLARILYLVRPDNGIQIRSVTSLVRTCPSPDLVTAFNSVSLLETSKRTYRVAFFTYYSPYSHICSSLLQLSQVGVQLSESLPFPLLPAPQAQEKLRHGPLFQSLSLSYSLLFRIIICGDGGQSGPLRLKTKKQMQLPCSRNEMFTPVISFFILCILCVVNYSSLKMKLSLLYFVHNSV